MNNAVTRGIGQSTADTSHMPNAEFVAYSVVKYQDHSSIKRISDHMGKSEVPITFNFIEVSRVFNKVNPKNATGYDQLPPHCLRDGAEHLAGPICLIKLYISLASQLHTKLQN